MLSLRLASGGELPPQQLARIHQALEPLVMQAGFTYGKDLYGADYIINARYTPDPTDPNGGRVSVIDVNRNTAGRAAQVDDYDAKELRQKLRELERWRDNQHKPESTTPGF